MRFDDLPISSQAAGFNWEAGGSRSAAGTASAWGKSNPDAVAIAAPGRRDLDFRGLDEEIVRLVAALRKLGVSREDRVATALANGPEMAVAFLASATAGVAAPLNPQYTAAEFEFYLKDLQAKVAIVESGVASAIRDVAVRNGTKLLEIGPRLDAEAGRIHIDQDASETAAVEPIGGDAVALVLHTSGSTARPKLIPLSHDNLRASAEHVARSLLLGPSDRCLNLMPLFHIHGLVAGLLAPLSVGGSAVCCPRFSGTAFFPWLAEQHPTWYTAVPAIHQEVLANVGGHHETVAHHSLRFIRSSSASLPPAVMQDLERVFSVPVIEAYGMTEAAHQMASNPLPPGKRKIGSVGIPAGPEITILDEAGAPVAQGATGEIAIRGPNVSVFGTSSIPIRKPEAWFRTGDLGRFDEEGYLFVSGRLKEVINRGGEKISPREVDEILLEHPEVEQAVACAVPHAVLGEDVAAVVVRKASSAVSERDLRTFVSNRLAPFKVPSRVVFLDQIPKGATGKIQRIGLAERLGLELFAPRSHGNVEAAAPITSTEAAVAAIFKQILKIDNVGSADNFFELGGSSLDGVRAIEHIGKQFNIVIDWRELAFGTVHHIAAACDAAVAKRDEANMTTPTFAATTEPLPLWRRTRRMARKALASATRPVARSLPIERYPDWLGVLHDFKFPRDSNGHKEPAPGGGSNVRIVVELLEEAVASEGDVAECGVWKGATLIPMGLFLKQHKTEKSLLGFDTFEGLGAAAGVSIDMGGDPDARKTSSGFSDTSFGGLLKRIDLYGLSQSVRLVQGYFENTLQAHANRKFCFVHLDCVLHDSYKQCLEFFYPRMSRGGIILLDEYRDPTWPGATDAVDKFMTGLPETMDVIQRGAHVKYCFRKL